jgi:hypothetical protein
LKKVNFIFLGGIALLVLYNFFLVLFPLKKNVFYTNEERVEEFTYNKKLYSIVIAGSSLSGIFEGASLFKESSFMLYLPFTGSCTGIEIIRKTNKIPRKLFIEINHIDRGIDTALLQNNFSEPFYSLKSHFQFLLKKNQLLPNIIDRIKAPHNNVINDERPPAVLYQSLLRTAQKEWNQHPDSANLHQKFLRLEESLNAFSAKGCNIYFYELPMDSSLYKSPLLTYQRNYIINLAAKKGYKFIKPDTTRSYKTGDGVHLLRREGDIYLKYFLNEVNKLN